MGDVGSGEVYGYGDRGHTGTVSAQFCCEHKTTLKSSIKKQQKSSWHKDGLFTFIMKASTASPWVQEGNTPSRCWPSSRKPREDALHSRALCVELLWRE